MRTRIKICGLTREQDVEDVVCAGVDAVGLVFHAPSPRHVSLQQARALRRLVPPLVTLVGVFADAQRESIEQVLEVGVIDVLQFHGSESASFCASFQKPYIKAVPMGSLERLADYCSPYEASASAFLLDSHSTDEMGGTGMTFDWLKYQKQTNRPIVLSGGLTVHNVALGIQQLAPFAVDVSSGVEEKPGCKSATLVQQFVQTVQEADRLQVCS